jgi:hypothetical protein
MRKIIGNKAMFNIEASTPLKIEFKLIDKRDRIVDETYNTTIVPNQNIKFEIELRETTTFNSKFYYQIFLNSQKYKNRFTLEAGNFPITVSELLNESKDITEFTIVNEGIFDNEVVFKESFVETVDTVLTGKKTNITQKQRLVISDFLDERDGVISDGLNKELMKRINKKPKDDYSADLDIKQEDIVLETFEEDSINDLLKGLGLNG